MDTIIVLPPMEFEGEELACQHSFCVYMCLCE